MIDLYYMPTPNTWKISIMLEECGLPYRIVPVDIFKEEQFAPEFLKISPNNRVPAIVDHHAPGFSQSVFESGAILIYLAEKTGRFLQATGPERIQALEWLFWQVAGLGPMAGQTHHFLRYKPEGNEYAIQRYRSESARLYGVLDRQLNGRDWIASDYSIADIACWGWVWFHRMHGQDLKDYPSVSKWFFKIGERPAVRRAKLVSSEQVSAELRKQFEGPYYVVPGS